MRSRVQLIPKGRDHSEDGVRAWETPWETENENDEEPPWNDNSRAG